MHSSRMCTARSSSHQPGGSASVHAGIHPPGCWPGDPPQVWAWRPPQGVGLETPPDVGLETPPQVWAWGHTPPRCGPGDTLGVALETPLARPLKLPLGVSLETCKACWDTPPRDLQGMLGYHPPPPWTDRHM